MSENCNHDCASCSSKCSESTVPTTDAPHVKSKIKKVIGVVSGKGGVGKSLITAMSAVAINKKGFKSAILDADVTGPSVPKMFGITTRATGDEEGILPVNSANGIPLMSVNLLLENVEDPVVWRGPIIAGTVKQFWTEVIWGDVDYMFVDMPPGTGDVALTVFQSMPVDGIIIVTSPQDLVSMIVAKAVNMAKMMNIPIIGLVENYSYIECPDCGKKISVFGESKIDEVANKFGLKVLAKLPLDPKFASACDKGEIENLKVEQIDNVACEIEKI